MSALLLPNCILSLPAEAADRLTAEGDGDAALLYLALLRHSGPQQARRSLGWTDQRCAAAFQTLVKLELAQGNVETVAAPEEPARPPEYQRSDIMNALKHDGAFRGLQEAVESALDKPLSEADLQALYTVYDYLALPAEVIYSLVGWCVAETERKYGPGHRPRMPTVKKTAFQWKRLGVDTPEAAEEYLCRQQALRGREGEILPLLDIRDRAAVERERQYIAGWVDMGFDNGAIRLAYERTLFRKQSMNWAYMNSILKRWHAAGWHTAEQAEAEDRPPAGRTAGKQSIAGTPKDVQPTAERVRKNSSWLDQFLAQQEKEGGNG